MPYLLWYVVDISFVYWLVLSKGGNPAITPLNLGGPVHQCLCCGAKMWYEERLKKPMRNNVLLFSLCCIEGKIRLPLFKHTPIVLDHLLDYKGADCLGVLGIIFEFIIPCSSLLLLADELMKR